MPFKSEAQRRLFYAKAERGEIPKKTVKEWEEETPKNKKLPERVKKAISRIASMEKQIPAETTKVEEKPLNTYSLGVQDALEKINL